MVQGEGGGADGAWRLRGRELQEERVRNWGRAKWNGLGVERSKGWQLETVRERAGESEGGCDVLPSMSASMNSATSDRSERDNCVRIAPMS